MASEMSRRVGANIRKRRLELGLKRQRDLAARFEADAVDGQRISDWERGVNQPSERYQEELVKALELEDVGVLYEPLESEAPDLMDALKTPDLQPLEDRLSQIQSSLKRIEEALTNGEPPAKPPDESNPGSTGERRETVSSNSEKKK